jgi:cathepsin X
LGLDDGRKCSRDIVCLDCTPDSCGQPESYNNFTVDKWGQLFGSAIKDAELAMMNELYQRGPLACGIVADPLVRNNEDPDFIYSGHQDGQTDHDITIVGWGKSKKDGTGYWIVKNSWGHDWNKDGHFYVKKGDNSLQLEQGC